jgi:hypothetical protein
VNAERTRLSGLQPDRFAAFVADLAGAVWPEWEADVSPPSPEGTVEAVLRHEGGTRTRLVRACQYPSGKSVGAAAVEKLASVRDVAGHERAVLLATTDVAEAGTRAAERTDVQCYDAADLLGLAETAGVEVPEPGGGIGDVEGDLPPEAARWPPGLTERAREVVDVVDGCARFHRRTARAANYADLDFHPPRGGGPLAKLRFAERSLLIYVRTDGRFRTVAVLSASAPDRPPLPGVKSDLEAAITRALAEG